MQTDHSNSAVSTIQELQFVGETLQRFNAPEVRTLTNTLFSALFPNGRVASLNVTSERMKVFENVSSGVNFQGIRYLPIGSRKSVAKGELYLVDEETASVVARRFGQCGDALISYFDILVTPCTAIVQDPDLRVAFVLHVMPGHFDWRGCIKRSTAERLGLRNGLEQIVMLFAGTQIKGEVLVTEDHLLDKDFFGADIVLPTNAAKPVPSVIVSSLIGTLQGEATLGVTDIAKSEMITGCEMLFARMAEHVCSSACDVPIYNALYTLVEQQLKEKSSLAFALQSGSDLQRIQLS